MTSEGGLNIGIKLIKDLISFVNAKRNKETMKLRQNIEELYENTKLITDDYYKILINLKVRFLENNMTLDEVIIYLEESRIPFKTLRAYVGSFIEKGYYKKDEDIEVFLRGILGVLQGGLEKGCLNPQIYISDTFNNHTILDMIWKCELLRNEENPDELREILLGYIEKQLHELENAWKLVCQSYIELKNQYMI